MRLGWRHHSLVYYCWRTSCFTCTTSRTLTLCPLSRMCPTVPVHMIVQCGSEVCILIMDSRRESDEWSAHGHWFGLLFWWRLIDMRFPGVRQTAHCSSIFLLSIFRFKWTLWKLFSVFLVITSHFACLILVRTCVTEWYIRYNSSSRTALPKQRLWKILADRVLGGLNKLLKGWFGVEVASLNSGSGGGVCAAGPNFSIKRKNIRQEDLCFKGITMEKCLVHPWLVPVWTKRWLEVEESKELSIPVSSRCLLLGLNGSGTLAVLAGVANMFSHVLMSTNSLNGKLTLNEIVDYHWFEWTLAIYLYGWIWTQLLYITVQWKCTCMLAKDYMQLTFIACWRSSEYGLQVHSGTWVPALCVRGCFHTDLPFSDPTLFRRIIYQLLRQIHLAQHHCRWGFWRDGLGFQSSGSEGYVNLYLL